MLINNIPAINKYTLKALYDKFDKRRSKMIGLYERYKSSTDGVPILTRTYSIAGETQNDKINNKINNDFFKEIIDMKVGFFCGVPISYTLDKGSYTTVKNNGIVGGMIDKLKQVVGKEPEPKEEKVVSPAYDADLETIEYFNKTNVIDDLDAETSKMSSICGYTGRMFYMKELEQRVMLIKPWECVFIGDSIEEPLYSVRFYETTALNEKGEGSTVYHADVYDAFNVTRFTRGGHNEEFSEGTAERHMMPGNPLIGFANNEELLGDAEAVVNAIDGYDRTMSDINSEMEQFRMAYLAVIGASIDKQTLQAVRQTGAFSLPDKESSISFITKEINDAVVEHHLDRLERNIYRFSRTPNMNDISFSGDVTGIALKYKFRSFEDKCKTSELKFKKALRAQYKLLCDIWAMQGTAIDYLDVDFIFTRNYPQNLIEEITFLQNAKGIISEETAFSLVSFIERPEEEIAALEMQQEKDLDEFVMRNEAMAVTAQKDEDVDDTKNSE